MLTLDGKKIVLKFNHLPARTLMILFRSVNKYFCCRYYNLPDVSAPSHFWNPIPDGVLVQCLMKKKKEKKVWNECAILKTVADFRELKEEVNDE